MKSRFAVLLLALMPLFASPPILSPVSTTCLSGGQAYAPLKGKVEVVEVFGYTCIHCAHFQRRSTPGTRSSLLGAFTRSRRRSAAYGRLCACLLRRGESGRSKQTHDAVFKALHEDGALPIQNASTQEIAGFLQRLPGGSQGLVAARKAGDRSAAGTVQGIRLGLRHRRHADDPRQRQVPGDRTQSEESCASPITGGERSAGK